MSNIIIPTLSVFKDARGSIELLFDDPTWGSVSRIYSEPGSRRANHYHKEDKHVCMVQYGRIIYYERPVGSQEKPKKIVIEAGETFYTQPMVEHTMIFPTTTLFICFSKLSRMQDNYEKDTVRLDFNLDEQ
jgi:dTDP-4-dehydrorhamnose 3,5-epimerase-like enzyme